MNVSLAKSFGTSNGFKREINFSKEEDLFNRGINNAVYGEPPKEEGAEIDF